MRTIEQSLLEAKTHLKQTHEAKKTKAKHENMWKRVNLQYYTRYLYDKLKPQPILNGGKLNEESENLNKQ